MAIDGPTTRQGTIARDRTALDKASRQDEIHAAFDQHPRPGAFGEGAILILWFEIADTAELPGKFHIFPAHWRGGSSVRANLKPSERSSSARR